MSRCGKPNRTDAREFRRSLRCAHRAARHDSQPFWRLSSALAAAFAALPEDHPLRAARLRLEKLHGVLSEAQREYRAEIDLLAMLILGED